MKTLRFATFVAATANASIAIAAMVIASSVAAYRIIPSTIYKFSKRFRWLDVLQDVEKSQERYDSKMDAMWKSFKEKACVRVEIE